MIHKAASPSGRQGAGAEREAQLHATAELQVRQLTHERDLLADALGRVLVASGIANDVPLTGPQLLLLADDLVEHLTGART